MAIKKWENTQIFFVIFPSLRKSLYLCSRMKKRLSIFMTALAILLTMVAVGIHHHHHGEMMYLVVAECSSHANQDKPLPESHVHHYLASDAAKLLASCHESQHPCQHPGSAGFVVVAQGLLLLPIHFNSSYPIHPDRNYLSWIQQSSGLRGPPALK